MYVYMETSGLIKNVGLEYHSCLLEVITVNLVMDDAPYNDLGLAGRADLGGFSSFGTVPHQQHP